MNGSKTYILVALVVVTIVGIGGSIIRPAEIVWILGFTGTITGNLFLMLRQEKVAEKLDETTQKQDAKLDGIAEVGVKTLKYSNSAMGRSLRLTAGLARDKANAEPTESNKRAADLAERELKAHEETQDEIDKDAREGKA